MHSCAEQNDERTTPSLDPMQIALYSTTDYYLSHVERTRRDRSRCLDARHLNRSDHAASASIESQRTSIGIFVCAAQHGMAD